MAPQGFDQVKFAAINPIGEVCGPIGDTSEFVKEALVIGYRRTIKEISGLSAGDEVLWNRIVAEGYTIQMVGIKILGEEA